MKKQTENFRERLSTSGEGGKRIWIYPKIIKGLFYKYRTVLSWVLLALLFSGPFLRWNGHPLFLFDVLGRRFIVFGQLFFPQDYYLLALGMLTGVVFLVLFTAIFGRVWCGWACPQTIFMEMVFRKIENWIEGTASQQKKLSEGPWTTEKIWKKTLKHFVFWVLSFCIANLFLAYLVGTDVLYAIITDPISDHITGFIAIIVFTSVFYLVFSQLREIACIMICPYGRLQGVLLDKNSVVIAYDYVRGEPRGKVKKEENAPKIGDCVDCRLCVEVCPTGIDIRNGTQLECVNCTACIDACDSIMEKLERPKNLIKYASENQIAEGASFKFTPRMKAYTLVFTILMGVFSTLMALRSDVQTILIRSKGTTFTKEANGIISNMFNVRFTNKTYNPIDIALKLKGIPATVTIVGDTTLHVLPGQQKAAVLIIRMAQKDIHENNNPFELEVYDNQKLTETLKSNFMAPVYE